jgi:hypothetical protein
MDHRFYSGLAFGFLALAFSGSGALADHQWSTYHWERQGASPLQLTIGDCHTPSNLNSWPFDLAAVIAEWDRFSGEYLGFVGLKLRRQPDQELQR